MKSMKGQEKKDTKVTKKSILIRCLKKGATLEEIAKKQVAANLGDLDRCKRTTLLWLHKREFKEQFPWKKEDDVYKLAQ